MSFIIKMNDNHDIQNTGANVKTESETRKYRECFCVFRLRGLSSSSSLLSASSSVEWVEVVCLDDRWLRTNRDLHRRLHRHRRSLCSVCPANSTPHYTYVTVFVAIISCHQCQIAFSAPERLEWTTHILQL